MPASPHVRGLPADHRARVGHDLDLGLLVGYLLLDRNRLGRFVAGPAVVHDSRRIVADAFTLLVVEREAASFCPRSRRHVVDECGGVVEGRRRQVHVRVPAVLVGVDVVRVFQSRHRRGLCGVGGRTVGQRIGPHRAVRAVQLVHVLHDRSVFVARGRRHRRVEAQNCHCEQWQA